MYYEIKEKKLSRVASGKDKPECVFCGKKVSWGDLYQLCFEHGKVYYTIPKILRVILPKFLVWHLLQTIRQQRLSARGQAHIKTSDSRGRCQKLFDK